MTKIVPNDLLQPTEKCIKNWNCTFIAVEGPNVVGKLSLEDLSIPYDSQYRGKLVLPASVTDQPILFGFLGNSGVTCIIIKVTYDEANDPYYMYEKEYYNISYYFEDDPTIIRPIGRLLVLTGSVEHTLPKIFINNDQDYDVTLDIFMATINPE